MLKLSDDLVGQWDKLLLGLGSASQWGLIPYMYFKGRSRNFQNGGVLLQTFQLFYVEQV